ncbi:MAG: hypothetical protein Q3993_06695 [Filifactor alocis]|nr:hypothetical protein [Filifactor alocis]
MKKFCSFVLAAFLIIGTTTTSLAVKKLDQNGEPYQIDPKEVEEVYIDSFQSEFVRVVENGNKEWYNNGFIHGNIGETRVTMDMKPDNPKTENRVPLSYPANISFRVPKNSKVSAGVAGEESPMYRVKFETQKYVLDMTYIPRESLVFTNEVGFIDIEVIERIYRAVKEGLNSEVEFGKKEAILGTILYERATSSNKDCLVGSTSNGGLISIRVTPKGKYKLKKDWMNRFITGLEVFDVKQPINFYQSKKSNYTNPLKIKTHEEYKAEEQRYLKENYDNFGRTSGWYDGVG